MRLAPVVSRPTHVQGPIVLADRARRPRRGALGGVPRSAASRAYAKFLVAKSQFTSVQNASQNLGRAFR